MLKDIYKPGRNIKEYINEDGTPNISCISCGVRISLKYKRPGDFLCKNAKMHSKCNPNYPLRCDFLLWVERIDYSKINKETYISEEEFNV